jgi:hypothetical protein
LENKKLRASNPVRFEIVAMKGDFNEDGYVEHTDCYIMIADISAPTPHDIEFDLNEDENVNITDASNLPGVFTNTRDAACDLAVLDNLYTIYM